MTAWGDLPADPDHIVSGVRRLPPVDAQLRGLDLKARLPVATPANLQMVTCEARQMRLTQTGCAKLFLSTLASPPKGWEGRSKCATCAVGAARAGRTLPPARGLTFATASWCFRCEKNAERVIHGRLCISCYNREREAVGSTASAKVRAKPGIAFLKATLARRHLVVVVDDVPRAILSPLVRDMREAIAVVASKSRQGIIGRPRAVWQHEMAA